MVWGILLSDVARHVANALSGEKGLAAEQTLRQIRASFNYEMDSPTAEAKGEFV